MSKWAASAIAIAALSTPVAAQTLGGTEPRPAGAVPPTSEAVTVDDVVVTALRETTLLSKTPVAVTAVSDEALRELGVTDPRGLATVVPNVSLSEQNQGVVIQIRGISSDDTTEKGDPSAAFLIDGVYIARPQDQVGAFYDLERVEVLRGPQGTLYGRNTTAGAINVISARPKSDFEASLDAEFGSLGTYRATAMVNAPVAESLAVRAAVNFERQDSYLLAGVPSPNGLNPARNLLSGRLSFGGDLSERAHFVVRAEYARERGSSFSTLPLSNFFPGPLVQGVNPDYVDLGAKAQRTLTVPLANPARKDVDRYGVAGEGTYDFGPVQLTYLGSYRESQRDDLINYAFAFGQTPAPFDAVYRQQSHELRAAFGTGSPLHGQVGAYYFRETGHVQVVLGPPLATVFFGPTAIGYDIDQSSLKNQSQAVFGQITYDITPDLRLTGGIRYTDDLKARFGESSIRQRDGSSIPLSPNAARAKFDKITWRVGVDYDAPGLGLIYASVATGYKAGGFNDGCPVGYAPGCTGDPATFYFDPEELTAYEAGIKFRFGRSLRVSGSVFHYDYTDLQLSQAFVQGGQPVQLTLNAGKAKVDGVELEAVLTATPNDRIDLSLNYTDARYTDFVPNTTFPNPANPLRFDGKPLDRVPKWSGFVGYTHTFELGGGETIELSARTRFSSAYYLKDLGLVAQYRQPGYTKSDIVVTYRPNGANWYVQGYANNLENNITIAAATSGLLSYSIIEQPRRYGLRAGVKF